MKMSLAKELLVLAAAACQLEKRTGSSDFRTTDGRLLAAGSMELRQNTHKGEFNASGNRSSGFDGNKVHTALEPEKKNRGRAETTAGTTRGGTRDHHRCRAETEARAQEGRAGRGCCEGCRLAPGGRNAVRYSRGDQANSASRRCCSCSGGAARGISRGPACWPLCCCSCCCC